MIPAMQAAWCHQEGPNASELADSLCCGERGKQKPRK
jgi:hypothetical protein